MKIAKLKKNQTQDVALMHIKCIPTSFLSTLGVRFLGLIYGSIVDSRSAVCFVAETDGRPIGFISGAISVKGYYREFLKKNFISAIFAVFAGIWRPASIVGAWEILFYPVKTSNELPDAEILSMAIEEDYKGRGVSTDLFMSLAEEFKARGVREFKAIVGARQSRSRAFFTKMGGRFLREIEVHNGKKSDVYIFKTLPVPEA